MPVGRLTLAAFLVLVAPAGAGERIALSDGALEASTTVGDLTVDLRMEVYDEGDYSVDTPVLRISRGGVTVFEMEGEIAGRPQGDAVIVEADGSSAGPEVVFSSRSGLHCCTTVQVLRQAGDGWGASMIGAFHGADVQAVDLDGDGVAEIALADAGFLHEALDCRSCPYAPLRILSLEGGGVTDVSTETRFRPAHVAWLARLEQRSAEAGGERGAAFWVGWVAQKSRVGEGREAYRALELAEAKGAVGGNPLCAQSDHPCPAGPSTETTFAVGVAELLARNHYPVDR